MKVPCGVVRDLLPLYAEDLAGEESRALVEEHLADCPDCRKQYEDMKQPKPAPEPDGAEALRAVKRDIRLRRLTAVLLAALLVFLPLFTLLARGTEKYPLSYEEAEVQVESDKDDRLTLSFGSSVAGVESERVTDPDSGERILLVQAWNNRLLKLMGMHQLSGVRNYQANTAYHDRVIYGFSEGQVLLHGEPMDGGVQILPRLVLGYYLLLSLAAAVILGLLWLVLRKKNDAMILRTLFFAALSYPVGHLLIKGTQTMSFFLLRDLAFILIAAAAVWGLLMLGWSGLQRKRAEKA